MPPFVDLVAAAPPEPGVYVFVGGDGGALYIGKAASLRSRLKQHAAEATAPAHPRHARLFPLVHRVVWETTASEELAAMREAALIVASQPPFNAAISGEATWSFVVLAADDGTADIRITVTPGRRHEHTYGCFPILGKGAASRLGTACSDGFTALLRLMWAAHPASAGQQYPRAIAGPSPPPRVRVPVEADVVPALGAALAGTSRRAVGILLERAGEFDRYRLPALRRDAELAARFLRYGPQWLRALRREHRLPAGPVARDDVVACLRSELRRLTEVLPA